MNKRRPSRLKKARLAIQDYPERAAALGELHAVTMAARYSAEPHGSGAGRTTETVALRELPASEQLEYEAVREALEYIKTCNDGERRIEMIRRYYWAGPHRLNEVAEELYITERTAQRWNSLFVSLVASNHERLIEKMAGFYTKDGV